MSAADFDTVLDRLVAAVWGPGSVSDGYPELENTIRRATICLDVLNKIEGPDITGMEKLVMLAEYLVEYRRRK